LTATLMTLDPQGPQAGAPGRRDLRKQLRACWQPLHRPANSGPRTFGQRCPSLNPTSGVTGRRVKNVWWRRPPPTARGTGLVVKSAGCDQFCIEFPLFAFSHCRDFVAAVTNAGGSACWVRPHTLRTNSKRSCAGSMTMSTSVFIDAQYIQCHTWSKPRSSPDQPQRHGIPELKPSHG
jgi:hypothetical protein